MTRCRILTFALLLSALCTGPALAEPPAAADSPAAASTAPEQATPSAQPAAPGDSEDTTSPATAAATAPGEAEAQKPNTSPDASPSSDAAANAEATPAAPEQPDAAAAIAPATSPEDPVITAVRQKLASEPDTPSSDEPLVAEQDAKERAALSAFYAARTDGPLWANEKGLTDEARAVIGEIRNGDAWGLSPNDIALPEAEATPRAADVPELTPDAIADLEIKVASAALRYARYARGGRIMDPTTMLDSNLDRKPQLVDPAAVLDGLAVASAPDAYLRDLNPKHPQFEKLRQVYLSIRAVPKDGARLAGNGPDLAPGARSDEVAALRQRLGLRAPTAAAGEPANDVYGFALKDAVVAFQRAHGLAPDGIVNAATREALRKPAKADAKKLLANMEEWRWMPSHLGNMHMIANVPEYMLHLYKDGEIIHTERIVVGETGKQTTIYTRSLKHIVFRPKWRVPESIKVKELWPSLLRGGGMFRQYGLQLETKDGQVLDYRKFDWTKTDIRDYYVIQPPGRKSVLGVVKFSFPSQHTIFMHDTPDKWMFTHKQRTLSHGCLRLRNPVRLAEIILSEDKGWDDARIAGLIKSGPLNNEVAIETKIPIHMTYFTAWVDDKGALKTYSDVYGHEKRIRLALDGKWSQIVKKRDHLAPVQLDLSSPPRVSSAQRSKRQDRTPSDFIGSSLGGGLF